MKKAPYPCATFVFADCACGICGWSRGAHAETKRTRIKALWEKILEGSKQ